MGIHAGNGPRGADMWFSVTGGELRDGAGCTKHGESGQDGLTDLPFSREGSAATRALAAASARVAALPSRLNIEAYFFGLLIKYANKSRICCSFKSFNTSSGISEMGDARNSSICSRARRTDWPSGNLSVTVALSCAAMMPVSERPSLVSTTN